jgi:uncharacterized metal-binding protein YceD (DUF177 family)
MTPDETPELTSTSSALSVRVASLRARRPTRFSLTPDAAARAALAAELGASALRKLRFTGTILPEGRTDWRIEAELGATVVQPCVISLHPVTTRIDTPLVRRLVTQMPAFDADQEMADETLEPLGAVIDLGAMMVEALALEMPDYPRADGSGGDEIAPPRDEDDAMTDAPRKPFAALADLLNKKP